MPVEQDTGEAWDSGSNEARCLAAISSAIMLDWSAYAWLQQHRESCETTPGVEYLEDIELVFNEAGGNRGNRITCDQNGVTDALLRAAFSGSLPAILLLLDGELDAIEKIHFRLLAAQQGHLYSMRWLSEYYSGVGFAEETLVWQAMYVCGSRFALVDSEVELPVSGKAGHELNELILSSTVEQQLRVIRMNFSDPSMTEKFEKCVKNKSHP